MRIKAAKILLVGLCVLSATVVPGVAQPKNQVVATIPVGLWPFGVVVNPASGLIYVANEFSNSVSVIEATTNTVAVVIPVGINPVPLAITPDGATVYAANPHLGQIPISVINTPTNTVTNTIDLGSGNPVGTIQLAVSPDGTKLYVATGFQGQGVPVIDTSTNEVSGTINIEPRSGWIDQTPCGVVFNSSGQFAYVTFAATRKRYPIGVRLFVSKIDTATEKQVNLSAPFGISDPGSTSIHGNTLYVVDDQEVIVFDTKTNKVVKTIPLPRIGPQAAAVTPDGKYLYVTYSAAVSGVLTIDTTTYEFVGSPIQLGHYPRGIAIAPDGLRAYVTDYDDNTVSVIDISTQ